MDPEELTPNVTKLWCVRHIHWITPELLVQQDELATRVVHYGVGFQAIAESICVPGLPGQTWGG